MTQRPIVFKGDDQFLSERLNFRTICAGDSAKLLLWRSAPHVCRQSKNSAVPMQHEHDAWLNALLGNPHSLRVIISEREKEREIGVVACDYKDNQYVLSYYLGEPEAQGKGYMFEALRAFLSYLMNEYGLEEMVAEVIETNGASVALLNKLGGLVARKEFLDGVTWLYYRVSTTGMK